jgi:chitin disaccharide deacetylase
MSNTFSVVYRLLFSSIMVIAGTVGCSAPSTDSGSIRLIIRADDLGSSHAANLACIRAFREGIVRSVEVMVPCGWYPEAVELLRENLGCDVGVHLTLTSEWDRLKWAPITRSPELVGEDGYLSPTTDAFLALHAPIPVVEKELRAQIERAVRDIPTVTHLSTHMGTAAATPELQELITRLADEYGLPVDIPGMRLVEGFDGSMTPEKKTARLVSVIENLKPGLWMLLEHPGMDVPEMQVLGHTGYEDVATDRSSVTAAFISSEAREAIQRMGVVLISYGEVLGKR